MKFHAGCNKWVLTVVGIFPWITVDSLSVNSSWFEITNNWQNTGAPVSKLKKVKVLMICLMALFPYSYAFVGSFITSSGIHHLLSFFMCLYTYCILNEICLWSYMAPLLFTCLTCVYVTFIQCSYVCISARFLVFSSLLLPWVSENLSWSLVHEVTSHFSGWYLATT